MFFSQTLLHDDFSQWIYSTVY